MDGLLYFYESKEERRKIIVQVKGGGVKRNDVATLLGDGNTSELNTRLVRMALERHNVHEMINCPVAA